MSSPKIFIEEQLARRADIVRRIEMMKNYLAGASENAVGSGENYEDTTQRDIDRLEAEIADIDARVARCEPVMPKGPHGEKRPADAIGRAIMVAKIATGEIEEQTDPLQSAAAELGRKGGKARAAKMSPERRAEIAKKAASKRWGR